MGDPTVTPTQTTPQAPPPQQGGAGGEVYIRDPYGQIRKGPASDVQGALAAGATLLTPDEVAQHEAEKQYGGIGNALAAGAINAGDMLTLGFGKGLAAQIGGPSVAKYMQGVDLAHPVAATVGAGLGIIAPAILSGGESLAEEAPEAGSLFARAGRALSAPTEAVTGLGEMAERGMQGLVGTEADSAIGRAAQKGLAYAASGAAEGAVYGAGDTYSDAAIQNHDLTAEQLIAGMAKGAFYGGGLSGALGAGSSLVGSAGEKLLAGAGDKLENISNSLAMRATGAKTPEIKALERAGIDPNEMGSWILNELPKYTDKPLWQMSREDITNVAEKASDSIGEAIGDAILDLDSMAKQKGVKPNVQNIVSTVSDNVIQPLRNMPGLESHANRVQNYMDSFAEKAGVLGRDDSGALVPTGSTGDISFAQFKDFRVGLDRLIRESGAQQEKIIGEAFGKVRDVLESEINTQGADVAGQEWLDRYNGLKKQYKFAENLQQTGEKADRRLSMNRGVSLTDTIAGSAMMGGLTGGIEGAQDENPVEGIGRGILGGVVAGLAHKAFREHADQIGAYVLNRASKVQAIKAMAARTDGELETGLDRFFGSARKKLQTAAVQATVANRNSSYQTQSDAVQQLASSPAAMAAHVAQGLPPADVAGKLAPTMAMKQASAINYLASQIPQGFPASPLTPTVKRPPPAPKVDAWLQKLDVYKDPVGVVSKNLSRGTLTTNHVTALKAMYPALYQSVQEKTMQRLSTLAAKDKLPPFEKRLQLGVLLGIPADASLEPSFIQSQQQLYSNSDREALKSVGAPPSAPQNQRGARSSLAAGEDSLDERT